MYYEIDSIVPDGSSIFYSKTTEDTVVGSGASVGDRANDFRGWLVGYLKRIMNIE